MGGSKATTNLVFPASMASMMELIFVPFEGRGRVSRMPKNANHQCPNLTIMFDNRIRNLLETNISSFG